MRGRAGNFAIWTLQPGHWDGSGMNSGKPDGIVSHCLQYFHFTSIPFKCSDTALKVGKAMIIFMFIMFASFLQFRARSSLQDFWPFSFRKPGWDFWYEYKVTDWPLHPGQSGQPGSCEEALSRLLCIHHIPLHRISKNRHSDECIIVCSLPRRRF